MIGTLVFYSRGAAHVRRGGRARGERRREPCRCCDRDGVRLPEAGAAGETRRLLAEASDVLASSLDYETTLANVAALVVPKLADWCVVDVVGEDGEIQRLAVAHEDPGEGRTRPGADRELPMDPDAPQGVPR